MIVNTIYIKTGICDVFRIEEVEAIRGGKI